MAKADIAQYRATYWLQKRGIFAGLPSPVKRKAVLAALQLQSPQAYEVLERIHGPEEIEHILVGMCGSLGIDLRTKGKTPEEREEKNQKRLAKIATLPDSRRPSQAVNGEYIGRIDPSTDAFLRSYEWRKLRMQAIRLYGNKCLCCGAMGNIHVDHIKPRKLFPELALSLDNLQVLCEECNHGKGNWDMTDWRPKEALK